MKVGGAEILERLPHPISAHDYYSITMERQPQKWISVLSKWREREIEMKSISLRGGSSCVVCADAVFPLSSFSTPRMAAAKAKKLITRAAKNRTTRISRVPPQVSLCVTPQLHEAGVL
jgi:hypothetical protein